MMGHAMPDGKHFFCREWVFSKLLHSLENLQKELESVTTTAATESSPSVVPPATPAPTRRAGILIVGGPGAGKSSLCSEIVLPTVTQGRQWTLRKSLLAYHFCQANDCDTLSLSEFVLRLAEQLSTSPLIPEYRLKLEEPNIREALVNLSQDPDGVFKEVVLLPLLEIPKPKQCCFLLVDSIDEVSYGSGSSSHREVSVSTPSSSKKSSSIEELLLNSIDLFPPWLIPVFTARKQNKSSQISGFRKISLDDLRKPQVVRDVQQYILLRLDQDSSLRQHITRETADMLNQLHIKSNGCFLYIEKVLDGVSDNFILLREIRDIPGTLNGLYLWMCQRLFTRKQFSKVGCILSVLLASRKPLLEEELFLSLQMRNKAMTREDFRKRMQVLKRVVIKLNTGYVVIFHHSFAEWLLDVKYCTQKFLCQVGDGHSMLAILFSHLASHLQEKGITELGHHLIKASILDPELLPNLILSAGSNVRLLSDLSQVDSKVGKLLSECLVATEEHEEAAGKEGRPEPDEIEDEEVILNEAKASLYEGGGEAPCEAEDTNCLQAGDNEEIFQNEPNSGFVDLGHFLGNQKKLSGSSYLHDAASSGNGEVVEYLLNTGVDVNDADKNGRTALHLAVRHGHEEIAMLLLDGHCDPDPKDKDGWTPLCAAASQGYQQLVILLLESGAAVNHRDRDGATPLLMAAFEGHWKVCETLLECEADIDSCDKVGRNPLWAAASMGHCNVAELLLFWGAYVDHIDGDGRTVLSVAAAQGNVGVVKLLLARGLDEGHRDNLGWTPLHYAAFEGHREVCEALIEAGARVNDVDNDGYHGLLLSAQEGHLHVVKSLINHEADLDHRSHDGQTALRVAATEGFKDIVQLLVSQGANVNYCDMDGRSTLYLLALENRVRMAQFLIFCGADVEARDFEGRTPLHVSSWQGHMKMVELLLSAGAVVDALDNDKRTPLQNAAWEGHENIVRLLCERGTEVDHMCNQGATALCISVQCGHVECVRVLLEYGANPKRSDRSGRTPVKVAQKSGHITVSRLLEEAIQSNLKSLSLDVGGGDEGIHKSDKLKPRPEFSTQGILDHGDMNTPHETELSGRSSVSPHSPILPPIASPKLDKQNSTAGSANHQRINLYFSNQVQQLSKKQGQAEPPVRSRQPTSPLYSSPPPLSPPNGNPPPLHLSHPHHPRGLSQLNRTYSNEIGGVDQRKKIVEEQNGGTGNEDKDRLKPALESFVRPTNNALPQTSPFAFTRDSHMKIILGSSNDANPSFMSKPKKGALGYLQNGGGISNATSVIRSGLSALRAGVLEATAGKRSGHTNSPLVSAASLAVPNVVKSKRGSNSTESSSAFPKKETQL